MLIGLEGAHVFSDEHIFGGGEHLRANVRKEPESHIGPRRFNVAEVPGAPNKWTPSRRSVLSISRRETREVSIVDFVGTGNNGGDGVRPS